MASLLPLNTKVAYSWTIGIIVVAFCVCASFLSVSHFCSRQQLTEIKITVEYNPDTTLSETIPVNFDKAAIDSIVSKINQQEEELNRNYNLFMKARQEDADILKIISLCFGLVLSLLAILWFRGIKEFLDTVQRSVNENAQETAKTETRRIVQGTVKDAISEQIRKDEYFKNISQRVYDRVSTEDHALIEEDVNQLRAKLDTISKQKPETPPTPQGEAEAEPEVELE